VFRHSHRDGYRILRWASMCGHGELLLLYAHDPDFKAPGSRPILSRLLQLRVALTRDHAAIAFLDVGVGFAGRAHHSCVSRHSSGFMKFVYQDP
jgi:hypothetical protein